MELETYQTVALLAFIGATLLGAMTQRTGFCIMGSISDWVNIGSKTRIRVWLLAIGVAMISTQAMQAAGWFDLSEVFYLQSSFPWISYLIGGLIFGIGMTLGSGCGQRTLVRVGGGNLKSLVVLMVMAITAYATLRGILAYVRVDVIQAVAVEFSDYDLPTQGLPGIVSKVTGVGITPSIALCTLLIGAGAVFYALKAAEVRADPDHWGMGLLLGLMVAAGWYVTAVVGFDEFDPVSLESLTFISPTADTLGYLMTYTGATIDFGVATVFGMIFGSFLYSVFTGSFRIESFANQSDLVNHLVGGVLMGFGGVLAFGCTIGQGVTGLSTLALGSVLAVLSIVVGCVVCLKMQYYLMDEEGWGYALKSTFADLNPVAALRRT